MSDNFDNEIKEKVSDLDQRIKSAKSGKEEYEIKQYGESAEETKEEKQGKRAASEFLANVIAGGFLGFLIDKYFGSAPMGIIFFILMGFVSGVMRANATMKKNE